VVTGAAFQGDLESAGLGTVGTDDDARHSEEPVHIRTRDATDWSNADIAD
jgi:hypothetical protein